MTLVFLQYPSVFLLFLCSAALLFLTGKPSRYTFLYAISTCLAVIIMLLLGLYHMVPVTELLILLLLLILIGFLRNC